ncbi:MAG: hypothetical protein QOD05_1474 [Microbacteriaceae bacterium]|nr:hypothetical protein [Microbacteriaceae bacterium]
MGCTPVRASVPPLARLNAPHFASAVPNPVLKPGVVATGELTSSDGKTSGHIVVTVRDDRNFDVTMSDFRTPITSELTSGLSRVPFSSTARCPADSVYIFLDLVSSAPTQSFSLAGVDDLIRGDPSFLDSVLLTQPVPAAVNGECMRSVVASASLTWTMRDVRPNLHVSDSGSTTAARGTETMIDGAPASYDVATNDVMAVIATRFGISVDDLCYLNPMRGSGPALAGEMLNLSKKLR